MKSTGDALQSFGESQLDGDDPNLSAFMNAVKNVTDEMDELRTAADKAGVMYKSAWDKGGSIEKAIIDKIRTEFLSDVKLDIADFIGGGSDYMNRLSGISKSESELTSRYTESTLSQSEIASQIAAIKADAKVSIDATGDYIAGLRNELENFPDESRYDATREQYTGWINQALARQAAEVAEITNNADAAISAVNELARTEEELAKIRESATNQIRATNMDLLNSVRGTAYGITGDTDILLQQLIDLDADWQKTDSQDFGAQYDILTKQNDILTQLRDIQKEQLEETIGNYTALQDVINDLRGGSMAPVQSKEFFEKRYDQLYAAAQSGKSSDINNLTGFISQYSDFMGAYGDTNYKDFTAGIISDFEALQSTISGGATIDDLKAQLEALNSANSPIVTELIRIGDILAGLTGSGSLTDAMAFDESKYLARYADVAAAVIAGQFISGLEHYQKFGEDEGRIPGFARDGAEIINIRPGSSAQITSNSETTKIIADAVSKAIGGALGGGANVTVHVSIDGKAIAPSMIKVIQTNPEAQYQIKRAANG